ncbi:hypothetical protein HBI24_152420 [Parastagonospora nodorum]|nr:hypothetical protein HBI06_166000 [Parastagonospora nodorum]KAH4237228.1 hypothetical protein HBI05_128420 [Parastagonospora nodorum]KAH5458068.1 hypothetical protein HBI30_065410 [Parastagonospora nodorum]KAH5579462.1 hypothetical protein HBI24_152420 [Parastagonospora nodorum]
MDIHINKKRCRDDTSPRSPTGSQIDAQSVNVRLGIVESGYIVVHCVECTRKDLYHEHHDSSADYFDIPLLPARSNRTTHLHGEKPLHDLESYLEDHPALSFAVYMTYDCSAHHDEFKDSFKRMPMPYMDSVVAHQARPYFYTLPRDTEPATPRAEKLILSAGLDQALDMFLETSRRKASRGEEDDQKHEPLSIRQHPKSLVYPYLELYYRNQELREQIVRQTALPIVANTELVHMRNLSWYLEARLSSEFAEAEGLFHRGLTNRKHWAKLYRPEAVVVTQESGQPRAYVCTSCPDIKEGALRLRCWSWDFDGKFFRNEVVLVISWPSDSDTIPITDLHAYPLRHAHEHMEQELQHRGEVFWACRSRKFVNYGVPLQGMEVQIVNLRYMIDTATYKLMHGGGEGDENEDDSAAEARTDLDEHIMGNNDIPPEPFALLLPAFIRGYGFHNKKWNRLLVKHIHDIQWNKTAFNHRLVLKEEKKELIRALISVHIGQKQTVKTDFMDGKGEGLIILLHGGPGTGKTLTAESVAEFAERPLYRVTCGDIGTDAEGVEKYLESVLFIGSTWGCVVLLDEADVFFEERTQSDIQLQLSKTRRLETSSTFYSSLTEQDEVILKTDVDDKILEYLYEQLADYMLQLSNLDFSTIGAVSKNSSSNEWTAGGRPLTYNMNELRTVASGYPTGGFPTAPFSSAKAYLYSLADEHLRFIARHQFKQLVSRYCLDDTGPFKPYCDDLQPSNMLADPETLRITAVLDFEFANSMPAQFAYDPPWWLLLLGPDMWLEHHSMEEFVTRYVPRMQQFLRVLEQVEMRTTSEEVQNDPPLSVLMRDSWDSGRFWFDYGIRKSFDVDAVYWAALHKDGHDELDELDDKTKEEMEKLVDMKMDQLKAYDAECKIRFS